MIISSHYTRSTCTYVSPFIAVYRVSISTKANVIIVIEQRIKNWLTMTRALVYFSATSSSSTWSSLSIIPILHTRHLMRNIYIIKSPVHWVAAQRNKTRINIVNARRERSIPWDNNKLSVSFYSMSRFIYFLSPLVTLSLSLFLSLLSTIYVSRTPFWNF